MKWIFYLIIALCLTTKSFSQKVTIEGLATDSTKGVYVIEVVVNDTLAKLMKDGKKNRSKYMKIYQDPRFVVRTDSTGRFQIKADLKDSLYFKSYEHKSQSFLVQDLIKQKKIKVVLEPQIVRD
ncbi:MAG TPA: hypothetical protein VF581_11430 [Flavobacterium sp.]|jgi:hypothetical protein